VLRGLDRADAAGRAEAAEIAAEDALREAQGLRESERARRARIAALEAELEALRRENEMLKAIDLDRPAEAPPP